MSYSSERRYSNSSKSPPPKLQQHISSIRMLHRQESTRTLQPANRSTNLPTHTLTALPRILGLLLSSKQLRHLVPALVVALLQTFVVQRSRGHLQQIAGLEHERQSLTKEGGHQGSSRGLAEGDGIRAVRSHARVERGASSDKTLLGATTTVHRRVT